MFRLSNLFFLLLLFSNSVFAHFSIDKSRLYFDRNNRFQTLTIRNSAEEAISYTVKINHVDMTHEGRLIPVKDEKNVEKSAKKLVRYSPRKGTILPGGSQILRFRIRKPAGLESGEYRSQLRVEGGLTGERNALAAKLAYNLPIIVRHGQTEASVDLDYINITTNEKQQKVLNLSIHRTGNRSLFGGFTIRNANEEVIGITKGISVYEPLNFRNVGIELTGPVTPIISVLYEELPDYGGHLKVEKVFQTQ